MLPAKGSSTSPRAHLYLKAKKFTEAVQAVKTKGQESKMSKTKTATLTDESKGSRTSSQSDTEHLKVALNMLLGSVYCT